MFQRSISDICSTCYQLLLDTLEFLRIALQSRMALSAENLFLRKQLALFQERQIKPQRATTATRLSLLLLSRWFAWKQVLIVVKPETFLRWHQEAFRLLWRWKSKRLGRPGLPKELRCLIRQMARDNPTWGQARIAAELRLKLGIQVSPRTVRNYLPEGSEKRRR